MTAFTLNFVLFQLELVINIIDHPRKTLITRYGLPLEPLKPFYPYHLELEQVRKISFLAEKRFFSVDDKFIQPLFKILLFCCFKKAGNDSKAKLFITLMLKTDELMLSSLQSDVFGLEVIRWNVREIEIPKTWKR